MWLRSLPSLPKALVEREEPGPGVVGILSSGAHCLRAKPAPNPYPWMRRLAYHPMSHRAGFADDGLHAQAQMVFGGVLTVSALASHDEGDRPLHNDCDKSGAVHWSSSNESEAVLCFLGNGFEGTVSGASTEDCSD